MHIYLLSESWLLDYVIVKSFIYTITLLVVGLDILKHFLSYFPHILYHTQTNIQKKTLLMYNRKHFSSPDDPSGKVSSSVRLFHHLSFLTSNFLALDP